MVTLLLLDNASPEGGVVRNGPSLPSRPFWAFPTVLCDLWWLLCVGDSCARGGVVLGSGTQGLQSLTRSPPPRLLNSGCAPSLAMRVEGICGRARGGDPGGWTTY